MIYKFDTEDKNRATCALVVYAIYRSRNINRFKVSTKMWDQITNFVKLSAKKSINMPEFIEQFRKHMHCEAIQPRYFDLGNSGAVKMNDDGSIAVFNADDSREFLTRELEQMNQTRLINTLISETAFIIMLVRQRLETEKTTGDE